MTTSFLDDVKLLQHEIHDEMKNSYIDYAMSVIVGRALAGCKRRIKNRSIEEFFME